MDSYKLSRKKSLKKQIQVKTEKELYGELGMRDYIKMTNKVEEVDAE